MHIPFCERLCPYCSFNRFPYNAERATRYFKNLREEMRMVADLGYDFESMYIGGGTPTIDIDELVATIDLAKELFSISEVSAETNPNHLYPKWIDPLVERVDRFSVGVQSLDDGLLKQMERHDKYGSALGDTRAAAVHRGPLRFAQHRHDLQLPEPDPGDAAQRDIELVKRTGANQVTFYPLMASPAVRESLKRTVGPVDYAREYRYYQQIAEGLADTFEPASSWTFSRTGGGMIDEYIVDYEDYVGLGSGAFSFLDGALYVNTFSLQLHAERIEAGKTPARAEARVQPPRAHALPLPDVAVRHESGQAEVRRLISARRSRWACRSRWPTCARSAPSKSTTPRCSFPRRKGATYSSR